MAHVKITEEEATALTEMAKDGRTLPLVFGPDGAAINSLNGGAVWALDALLKLRGKNPNTIY